MRSPARARRFDPVFTDEEWSVVYPRLLLRLAERRRERDALGLGPTPAETLRACEDSFLAFLPHWRFKVRDGGARSPVLSFAELWAGQRRFAELMDDRSDPEYPNGPWIFALKAGKLGFTELECAWDAWVALFRRENARVHLFSRDLKAAKELLKVVRFGLVHLPKFFGVRLASKSEPDGDNTTSLKLVVGIDDERLIKSYPTGENISIDQNADHVHLDEWAHMKQPKAIWEDLQTTVSPRGTLHIVTRGAGDDADVRELWEAAEAGHHELKAFFAGWREREGRDDEWKERETRKNTAVGIMHFAPEEPEDALAGDAANDFISAPAWDACLDAELPALPPGRAGDPLIVALDAAVSGDSFAIVGASRHPKRHADPAIRRVKVFRPEDFVGGRIDFHAVEGWLRVLVAGGCPGDPARRIEAHPVDPRWAPPDCGSCAAGVRIEGHNVFKLVYDPYQLEDMMQRFRGEGLVTCSPFDQAKKRVIADRGFLDCIIQRRLSHPGDAVLREHVLNARAKLQKGEDSKVRMVKKDDKKRIDAAVAASMAVDECLRLYL